MRLTERFGPNRARRAKKSANQGAGALVCLTDAHDKYSAGVVWWDTAEEALEADRDLLDTPCRPSCVGRHLVVVRDGEAVRVRFSVHEPPTPSLEEELVACYGEHEPRLLFHPRAEDNPPLLPAGVLDEWAEDDALASAATAGNGESRGGSRDGGSAATAALPRQDGSDDAPSARQGALATSAGARYVADALARPEWDDALVVPQAATSEMDDGDRWLAEHDPELQEAL